MTDGTTHSTGTTKESGVSIGEILSAAAQVAAAKVSDQRLKRDILQIGRLTSGLAVYLYRYLWSPQRFIGVMAQDVLRVKPDAVVVLPSGYLAVNYAKL